MSAITGRDLIGWGYRPGPWFKSAVEVAEGVRLRGGGEAEIKAAIEASMPPPTLPLRKPGTVPFTVNVAPQDEAERANVLAVESHMNELMRLPTAVAGAVMPDACPSDARPGTIPVGGVVATREAIHPGMHSADICCSVAITIFGTGTDPKAVLDAGSTITHFGAGGRPESERWRPPDFVMLAADENPFLRPCLGTMEEHFG